MGRRLPDKAFLSLADPSVGSGAERGLQKAEEGTLWGWRATGFKTWACRWFLGKLKVTKLGQGVDAQVEEFERNGF